MCRRCADVLSCQLEFAHAIERVLEIMRSLQQYEELLPTQLKLLASAGALFSSTRRLQTGGSGSSVGSFWLFQQLLSFRVSNEAHVLPLFDKLCRECAESKRANCWLYHTFVLSRKGFPNHKSPLRVSSRPESAGLTHTSSEA